MDAADFRDALNTLLFERAKRAADARTATLHRLEVMATGARVELASGEQRILVSIALPSGEASVCVGDTP